MNYFLLLAAKCFSTFERPKVGQKPQLKFSQNVIQAIFSSLKTRTPFGRPGGEAGFSKVQKSLHSFFENIVEIYPCFKNRLLAYVSQTDCCIYLRFEILDLFSIYHLDFRILYEE